MKNSPDQHIDNIERSGIARPAEQGSIPRTTGFFESGLRSFEELPQRGHELRNRVRQLEAALRRGTLAQELRNSEVAEACGPEISAAYRYLSPGKQMLASHLRLPLLESLGSRYLAMLQSPRFHFEAEPLNREHLFSVLADGMWEGEPPRFRLNDGLEIRLDQIPHQRYWGIGFTFGDAYLNHLMAGYVLRYVQKKLAKDIRSLSRIDAYVVEAEATAAFEPGTGHGQHFEMLMLNVLNEHREDARIAVVAEDFLEKTDLRLVVPDLVRKRGARVQITWSSKGSAYGGTTGDFKGQDEYIILSPFTLADALVEHASVNPNSELVQVLSGNFDPRRLGPTAIAQGLKSIFLSAMLKKPRGPFGPSEFIPPQLREFIRDFSESEAMRSTALLREREAELGGALNYGLRRKNIFPGREFIGFVRDVDGVGAVIDVRGSRALIEGKFLQGSADGIDLENLQPGDALRVVVIPGRDGGRFLATPARTQFTPEDGRPLQLSAIRRGSGRKRMPYDLLIGESVQGEVSEFRTDGVHIMIDSKYPALIPLRSPHRHDPFEYNFVTERFEIGSNVKARVVSQRHGLPVLSVIDGIKAAIQDFRAVNPVGTVVQGEVERFSGVGMIVKLENGLRGEVAFSSIPGVGTLEARPYLAERYQEGQSIETVVAEPSDREGRLDLNVII